MRKKVLSIALALMAGAFVMAQGTVDANCVITSFPYTVDFETVNCIAVTDGDGNGRTWGISANMGVDSSRCASVFYDTVCNDWIYMPRVGTPGTTTLAWKVRARSSSYPETYQVIAVRSSGSTIIFSETLTETEFVDRSLIFSVANNDTVRIAFRYISANKWALYIDDVVIDQPTDPVMCSISVVSNNEAWGTVTPAGTNAYAYGDTITLTAVSVTSTEGEGGQFIRWSDGNTNATRRVRVLGEASYTAIFEPVNCQSITEFPYNYSFDGTLGCWTAIDGNDDASTWRHAVGVGTTVTPRTGYGVASSFSWNNGARQANEYLVSPQIVLPAGRVTTLSWWMRVNGGFPEDKLAVLVSTTGDSIAAFTTTLYDTTPDASFGSWVEQSVSLAAYAGQTIYLAFHHHDSYGQNYLLLDDLSLTIGDCLPSSSLDVATACDSYLWNDSTYTTSDTISLTLTNSADCDSIATLVLTINASSSRDTAATACDSFTWRGQTYTASGTPTYTTTNAVGCDSTVTLGLTISPSTLRRDTIMACESYTWQGETYTVSTNDTASFVTPAGCDSILILDLTISDTVLINERITACDSYTWQGTTYTASTVQSYSNTSTAGCDSTVTLTLTINHSNTSAIAETACDSYTWHGTTYTASATPTYTTTNAAGCDSTVTLTLTINHSNTSAIAETACDSYTWHGTAYTASGTPTYTTTNVAGCDSTVTLTLTINHSTTASVTETACDSYDWNGQTYTASGTPTYTTTNAAGCDSTVTLTLTINHSTTASVTETACDSYDWNGQTYTASGTPTYTTTNAAGCDSTVTLTLTINYSASTTIDETATESYDWNGQTYTESGTYTWVGSTADGCDSTVTLNLTIEPVGVDDAEWNDITLSVRDNQLTVSGFSSERITLYDALGRQLHSSVATSSATLRLPAAGVYLLQVGHRPVRRIVALR